LVLTAANPHLPTACSAHTSYRRSPVHSFGREAQNAAGLNNERHGDVRFLGRVVVRLFAAIGFVALLATFGAGVMIWKLASHSPTFPTR